MDATQINAECRIGWRACGNIQVCWPHPSQLQYRSSRRYEKLSCFLRLAAFTPRYALPARRFTHALCVTCRTFGLSTVIMEQQRTDEPETVSACQHALAGLRALHCYVRSLSEYFVVGVPRTAGDEALAFAVPNISAHREAFCRIAS